jgi:ribonuclease Z
MIEVTILGTSSATPTLDRHPSSQHLNINGKSYLIDCGEGTQIQMHRYNVRASRIKKIFISHLHPDHILGLPGLLSSLSLEDRKTRLEIYCPENLEKILDNFFSFTNTFIGYEISYFYLSDKKGDVIYEDEEVKISSFPVQHRVPCWAFLFTEKKPPRRIIKDIVSKEDIPYSAFETLRRGFDYISRDGRTFKMEELTEPNTHPDSYAYITDTKFLPELANDLKDCIRLLYHESTYTNDMEDKAIQRFHSTAGQAAAFARAVKADTLLIGHFSSRYKDLSTMLMQAREVFPETYLAEEGKKFSTDS